MLILFSILFAAIIGFLGGCLLHPSFAVKMPRLKLPGMILGAVCLVWCAYEGCLMLEGPLAKFHPLIIALVPAGLAGGYFFLDYLLARSLGGLLLLVSNTLLHEAFVYDCQWRGVFCVVCLVWGLAGLFLVASPWWLRISYEWLEKHSSAKKNVLIVSVFSVLVLLIFPLL